MKVLLDTHCFLWWISEKERLNEKAKLILANGQNAVYLSAASAWEIAIKVSIGKLTLPEPPSFFVPSRLAAQSIEALPINHVHALHVEHLPPFHKDPFDRMLVAQAQIENLAIVTADRKLLAYPVEILWAGIKPRPAASPASPLGSRPLSRPRERKRSSRRG